MEADSALELRRSAVRAALAERELEIVQKRLQRECTAEKRRDRHEVLRSFIAVLDNLDRAIGSAHDADDSALLSGVELVRKQFHATLADFGVETIDAELATFDPREHEAVATTTVADPVLDGRVASVTRQGYRIGDDILRPAQVVVGVVDRRAE